jgi:hypothetical protein
VFCQPLDPAPLREEGREESRGGGIDHGCPQGMPPETERIRVARVFFDNDAGTRLARPACFHRERRTSSGPRSLDPDHMGVSTAA